MSQSNSSSESHKMSNWFSLNSKCWPIPVAISILMISTGCLCVMVFKYGKERSKPKGARILMRSASIGLLHGGKLAMQRLLDSHNALANMAILNEKEAEAQLQDLLDQEKHDFRKLQSVIGKLEMSGKEDEAIAMLEKAKKKADEEGKHHEAYEFQMFIVEIHIYQGKHREALKCECLIDEEISDARRPLYKAIINILEGKIESAQSFWEDFQKIRKDFKSSYDVEGPVNDVANHFDKFQEVVKSLKKDIHNALEIQKAELQKRKKK